MYNLVIVESPAKAKTIEGYLGEEYKVVSSVGHIRDLAKTGPGGLGIDVDNEFLASYTFITGKKKVANEIKKLAKNADKIFIATDPDREGEAIGWHLMEILEMESNQENRIVFSEITKNGVLNGIKNVRQIDMNLVYSQESRRKIDRIMGFKLSKLLQKKIKAKSAGRVQSVALLMIVDREREILAFVPVEYGKLVANIDNKVLEYTKNSDKPEMAIINELYESLENTSKQLKVSDIKVSKKTLNPKTPYTTSTFQQDAINRLGYNSKKTMMLAQKLYEGIEINGELNGLITYMRTDSTRLSNDFVTSAMSHIKTNYGPEYTGFYKTKKDKNSQDAHEAIRPTNLSYTPQKMKKILSKDQYNIYLLIWNRALASLMAQAKTESNTYLFTSENNIEFKTTNTKILFDGFRRVYAEPIEDESENFDFKLGDIIQVSEYVKTSHFTQPKPRYSEAKLIKALEENGVGRPSTYSSIIDTLKTRDYVTVEEKKFKPTESGILVIDKLKEFFSDIINVSYTSNLELELDEIALGQKQWLGTVTNFYQDFIKLMDNAQENMEQIQAVETGNICPECGNPLVMRKGRYGEFEACSNFPSCKYIVAQEREQIAVCKKCGGSVIEKKTRRGKIFYGCENYPKCDFAAWTKEEL